MATRGVPTGPPRPSSCPSGTGSIVRKYDFNSLVNDGIPDRTYPISYHKVCDVGNRVWLNLEVQVDYTGGTVSPHISECYPRSTTIVDLEDYVFLIPRDQRTSSLLERSGGISTFEEEGHHNRLQGELDCRRKSLNVKM